jgi:probable HAF family extracellular repeat protein
MKSVLLAACLLPFQCLIATTAAAQSYTLTDLGSLGGTSSASAVNAAGEVVGSSITTDSQVTHAFYWTPASGMVDMGTLGGNESQAYGVNVAGLIVGSSNQTENENESPFVWSPVGGFRKLGTNGVVYAINDRGLVTGRLSSGANPPAKCIWEPWAGRIRIPGP